MICILSGTNRPASQTLRVARIYERLFKIEGADCKVLDLNQLPISIFHPDAYAHRPAEFDIFNNTVLNCQGLLVVTPEYNGSFPGVLKVFIDHLKFPESFERRPVAFCGVAAGMWGALRSVEQLEAIFKYRNAFSFSERVFIPKVSEQLTDKDEFKSELVKSLVQSQVKNFIQFSALLDKEFAPSPAKSL